MTKVEEEVKALVRHRESLCHPPHDEVKKESHSARSVLSLRSLTPLNASHSPLTLLPNKLHHPLPLALRITPFIHLLQSRLPAPISKERNLYASKPCLFDAFELDC